jgi:methionyl-tRNA synthetase
MNGYYVTTAIPYVNAAPHLGHALELVQADVLARHRRLRGQPVRFLTGTDENAAKNVAAARAAGRNVAEFVAANAEQYAALRAPLALSSDDFIRTSADSRHRTGVERLWRRNAANGDFYRRCYTGLYCAGCEQFTTPADLVDGRCPEHGTVPQTVAEENWYFRLSRYAPAVEDAIRSGRVRVEPAARRNEVLAFLHAGVTDISVSRPTARTAGWGIPVPDDPDQVVYVWWDALANYITALDDPAAFQQWWSASAERVHLIGKGIVRFHAVHWLALLTSLGLPLPTAVYVHPYLTVDGAKISKSSGNGVDPVDLVARFGGDAVRWWLVREVSGNTDTDFTVPRLVDRANRELANGLGNLVNRTVSLVQRCKLQRLNAAELDTVPTSLGPALGAAAALPARIDGALARFDFRAATDAIWDVVAAANRAVDAERPWELARRDAAAARLQVVLSALVTVCRAVSTECAPFIPDGAGRLRRQLGAGASVGPVGPAFLRLDGSRTRQGAPPRSAESHLSSRR